MAEFSRSGRGAALNKVLEQPLRRPGQHQATEQSTVETSSSVTQPTQQTSGVVKPMGRVGCWPDYTDVITCISKRNPFTIGKRVSPQASNGNSPSWSENSFNNPTT